MPELPEVETIVRQLKPVLIGQKIRQVKILDSKLRAKWNSLIKNNLIKDVHRIGKHIALLFENKNTFNEDSLTIHLRMTGRLIWVPSKKSQPNKEPLTYVRAVFSLNHGKMLFIDTRRFGVIKYHKKQANLEKIIKGCDPTTKNFTPEYLSQLLSTSRQEIKTWLMRQDRLVGLGNIYACESLYQAGINPKRLSNSLSTKDQFHNSPGKEEKSQEKGERHQDPNCPREIGKNLRENILLS